jgi:hypothetical protein
MLCILSIKIHIPNSIGSTKYRILGGLLIVLVKYLKSINKKNNTVKIPASAQTPTKVLCPRLEFANPKPLPINGFTKT